jgi:hypothetical protein
LPQTQTRCQPQYVGTQRQQDGTKSTPTNGPANPTSKKKALRVKKRWWW